MKNEDRKPRTRRLWKFHEAEAHFGELFNRARTEGPQRMVKQGGEEVVIMPAEEYDQLTRRAAQPISLVELFQTAPKGSEPLDLQRKVDVTRTLNW